MITPSTTAYQGVISFIKMTPLREQPNQEKWIRDEFDLIEALEITRDALKDTHRMIDKPMYAGESTFDFAEDVRRAVEEVYLSSREQKDVLLQRKRHLVMYHLVINPMIDDLNRYCHQDAVNAADDYFGELINFVLTNDIEVQLDDALVTQHICRAKIRDRDVARKNNIKRRKTVKKVAPEPEPDETDLDDE